MFISLLTMTLITLVYFISRNILITIVGGIAVILIMKNLEPWFTLLKIKLFPVPKINTMREQNTVKEAGRGVRILVVTEFTEFDPDDARSVELFDKIVVEAVENTLKSKPLFNLRYTAVCERNLPIQYSSCVSGEKNSGVRKCYRAWLKSINSRDFGMFKSDSEFFVYDGLFEDPATGEPRSSAVMFLFDSRLPKTITNTDKAPDAAAER